MEVEEVPKYLNRRVHYKNERHFIDADYIFTAYTLRRINGKVFRQAELQDTRSQHSIIIVPLSEVLPI